jgi:hypothetical protein
MLQILFHLAGDYALQNDWMAQNKTKGWWPGIAHALTYSALFAFIAPSPLAWLVICLTHFLIDRYKLAAKWIAFFERVPAPDAGRFGYSRHKPEYMAFWLMVIIDNTMHLAANYAAITYL